MRNDPYSGQAEQAGKLVTDGSGSGFGNDPEACTIAADRIPVGAPVHGTP